MKQVKIVQNGQVVIPQTTTDAVAYTPTDSGKEREVLTKYLEKMRGDVDEGTSLLKKVLSGNEDDSIESFEEVVNFFKNIKDDETLEGLLNAIRQEVAGKQGTLKNYVREFAAQASRVNQGARYNFLQLQYYLKEKTGVDASNIMGVDETLTLKSTTSGGNTFPLLSVNKTKVVEDTEKEISELGSRLDNEDEYLQQQINGEAITEDGAVSSGSMMTLIPADYDADSTYLVSNTEAQMAGPIEMERGDTLKVKERGDIYVYKIYRNGDNKVAENCTVKKLTTSGVYTAGEKVEVMLYDSRGWGLQTAEDSKTFITYTITRESLQKQVDDLKAMVEAQASTIKTLQTTINNMSNYSISTDDDQDPTTP